MKRLFVIAILLIAPLLSMGQNPKKVAVWETQCNGYGISSFKSGLVRARLEEAVDNTPDYAKYDRAAFDAVLQEHKFQRSGAVKDDDIRRMGEMAGVQYVIVPEVSMEDDYFYIAVRMIDVESGRSKTAIESCGTTAPEIEKACSALATKMFEPQGVGAGNGFRTPPAPSTDEERQAIRNSYKKRSRNTPASSSR